MANHAKFPPSKMHRLIACPASYPLESKFPDSRNDYADEGTVAHDIAATCLKKGIDAGQWVNTQANVTADGEVVWVKGGKFLIDEEFAAHVQAFVDNVRRLAEGKILLVEQRVEFSETLGVKDQFGTSDVIIIDVATGTLWVIDLKFGMGVKVYAEQNAQMLTYAVGVLETFADLLPKINNIVLAIHQPRIDHYDEWPCTMAEIKTHVSNMRAAVLEATVAMKDWENDRELIPEFFGPGKKACPFCKAEGVCPARAQWVAKQVADDFKALDDANQVVTRAKFSLPTPALLGARFSVLDEIESWCKAVRSECEKLVFAGEEIIGADGKPMKIVEGRRGHRAWIDAAKAEDALSGHLAADKLYKPREIITPSVADKLLNRKKTKAIWETIKPFYKQPDGQPTVVLGSDPRPVWTGRAEADTFPDLSAEDL